jgi:hypothetical protein
MAAGTGQALLMSRVQSRLRAVPALVAAVVAAMWLAATAEAAREPAPRVSGQKARVAQGVRVDLAASALPAAELAGMRPEFARLKPRARTNAE